jgi:hypothetical protein
LLKLKKKKKGNAQSGRKYSQYICLPNKGYPEYRNNSYNSIVKNTFLNGQGIWTNISEII